VFPPWLDAPLGPDVAVPGDAAGDGLDDEADAPPGAFSEAALNPEDPTEAAEVGATIVVFCTCIR
jgi:hypothetical protein